MTKSPSEIALFEAVIAILRMQLHVKEGLFVLAQQHGVDATRTMAKTLEEMDSAMNSAIAAVEKFTNG